MLNHEKIKQILPGITTYGKVKKPDAMEFRESIDPVMPRKSVCFLPFILFAVISNVIMLSYRMGGSEIYTLSK